MALGLSHGGSTIYSSSAPSREVIVATLDGLVTLSRKGPEPGSGWTIANRALSGSHVSSIVMAEPDLYLAGIFKGGIVASRDGGQTWERADRGVAHDDVYSVAATRLNGNLRLFAGTEPAHLYVSDDRARSWREMPKLRSVPSVPKWTFPQEPHIGHVKYITTAPDDPATIYAGVEQGGLLKSTDGGETWGELQGFDDDVHRVVLHPRNPKLMYLMTGIGLYVSQDGGASWERRTDRESLIGGYPDQLTFVPSHPEVMFASGAKYNPGQWFKNHAACSRISRSGDGGLTWELVGNGLPSPDEWQAAIEAMALEEWGASFSIFAATTAGDVFASDDGGASWDRIAHGLAPISKGDHYRPLSQAA